MINEPKYDGDLVTKSYVDRLTSELNTEVITTKITIDGEIANINKTYGAAPNPPYFVGNLYVDGTNLYRCKTERLIGAFNSADWELATEYPTTSYVDSTYTKPADFLETGSVSVNGGRITAGSIKSAHYVANTTGMKIDLDQDIIDSKNFKVNSEGVVTATNAILSGNMTITGGSLNIGSGNFVVTNAGIVTANSISLAGGNITWNGFNKPTKSDLGAWTTWIGPDGIYTGTLTASQVNAVQIDAGSIKTGELSADKIKGGNLTSTGLTSSSSINISRGSYYFTMGVTTSNPTCSGLTIGWDGLAFKDGFGLNTYASGFNFSSKVLNQVDEIHRVSNGNLLIKNDYNDGSSIFVGTNNLDLYAKSGASVTLGANVGLWGGHVNIANGIQVYSQSSTIWAVSGAIGLRARGTSYCWATNGTSSINGIIKTTAGDASSLILKKNLEPFNNNIYEQSLQLLEKINLYNYDLKYGNDKSKQYGFIIDELENIPETSSFFKFQENVGLITEDNGLDGMVGEKYIGKNKIPKNYIKYKNYDSDYLIKYLLTVCKAQQMKLDELEVKINER